MEGPLFVARDPQVFVTQSIAPFAGGRVFVCDQSRWYERVKDDNGHAYYVHISDSDEGFHRFLEEQDEPEVVELDVEDPLAALAMDEFAQAGRLYPEVPVVEDVAA